MNPARYDLPLAVFGPIRFTKVRSLIFRRTAALSAATVLGLLAVAGCSSSANTGTTASSTSSSSSGAQNAGLTDQQLLTAFKSAAAQATAVRLKGTMKSGTDEVALDLQLNKQGDSASGSITSNGTTIPIISVGGTTYVKMTDSVLKTAGSIPASVAAVLKDKWVSSKSSIGGSMAGGLAEFDSYDGFINGITSSSNGMVGGSTAAGTTMSNGQSVAVYKNTDGSIAYFAASGPAYLLEVQSAASTASGSLIFTWNQPTTVTAPPASQIYSGLG